MAITHMIDAIPSGSTPILNDSFVRWAREALMPSIDVGDAETTGNLVIVEITEHDMMVYEKDHPEIVSSVGFGDLAIVTDNLGFVYGFQPRDRDFEHKVAFMAYVCEQNFMEKASMRADVRDKWVEALRSGEYEQGTAQMKYEDLNGVTRHCCLGVLCDLAKQAGVKVGVGKVGKVWYFDGRGMGLPHSVMDWAGMKQVTGLGDLGDGAADLASLNDILKRSFPDIADEIERRIEAV